MVKCFVLMPLIEDMKCVYDDAIIPAVRAAFLDGCECVKADDQRKPGMVTAKIVHTLLNADLVIAVLADTRENNRINPNVMYELGIAHSFRKPAIIVADRSNGLPFDVRDVESIILDWSGFQDTKTRQATLADLREQLRQTLESWETATRTKPSVRPSRNPVTMHLQDCKVFIEDLPWLWGYCAVFQREYEAHTVWEITRDLFWPSESVFYETLKDAIRRKQKHYFLIPEDDGVLRKADAIYRQLEDEGVPRDQIDKYLKFTAIDTKFFELWPIPIVLYDADYATHRGGIICEPMESEVGHDIWDAEIRSLFTEQGYSSDLQAFGEFLKGLDWVERRREANFDIRLDGRVVDSLAMSFAQIWNERIREEATQKPTQEEGVALLQNWLIKG